MTADPTRRHRDLVEALGASVLDGPSVLSPEHRRAASRGEGVGEPFTAYVDAIHGHAYRITDDVVAGVRAEGAGQDEVFEVTIAAAYGAALERLEAGLRALRDTGAIVPTEPGGTG